jgi:hypothetical protein
LQRAGGNDRLCKGGRQASLLGNQAQDVVLAGVQRAHGGGGVRNPLNLHLIQVASLLFAVARDEGYRVGSIEQLQRALRLTWLHAERGRDGPRQCFESDLLRKTGLFQRHR